ncbi:MAG: glycosyltransferase family 4 protein [Thainema sp.]
MRIVAFTTELDVSRGGKQRSMLDVCRSLCDRNHTIDLLFLKDGDLRQSYAAFCRRLIQVQAHDINKSKGWQSVLQFGQSLRQTMKALRQGRTDADPTVLYIDDHMLSLFAYGLGRWGNWPVVFHIRQPVVQPMPHQYGWPMRRFQQYITVSQQMKQDWSQAGLDCDRIQVIHNGIDVERFTPGDPAQIQQQAELSPQTRIITYLGRLDPGKGLETLIEAVAKVVQAQPDRVLKLWIIGRPVLHPSPAAAAAYIESLQVLADRLGLASVVKFRPFESQPLTIYQQSDLTVLPSTYAEPFGRTLIESMACGTPALGSHVGGIPEILTGEFAAGLFPPGDAAALAQRIINWLDWRDHDPNLCDRTRQHVAHHFSLNQTVSQIEALLLKQLYRREIILP